MIQIIKMDEQWYGVDCSKLSNDEIIEKRIEGFINEGTPVIFCEAIEDLKSLDIYPEDIKMVELE